jgi:hypothetical protein
MLPVRLTLLWEKGRIRSRIRMQSVLLTNRFGCGSGTLIPAVVNLLISSICSESQYLEALPEESHAVQHILVPDAQLGNPLGVPVPRSPTWRVPYCAAHPGTRCAARQHAESPRIQKPYLKSPKLWSTSWCQMRSSATRWESASVQVKPALRHTGTISSPGPPSG